MGNSKLTKFLMEESNKARAKGVNELASETISAKLGSAIEIKKTRTKGRALVRCGPTFSGSLDESSDEASQKKKKVGKSGSGTP